MFFGIINKGDNMANIKIMALGGLGENGKNMYIVEASDLIFIIDAGLKYPDLDMYGVDAVVPDISYLIENKDRIAGIFVSHSHEDNIGAIPYLLSNLPINVYGTHFTISLIESSLTQNKMDIKKYRLYRINENKTLKFKDISVQFFNTSHSIPESVGIVISTSDGLIVYATDFNFMPTTEMRYSTSFAKLTDLGKEKVLALLTESIGTSAIGRISNDILLEHNFNNVLTLAKKRIIVAAYSSDLVRIQKIVDLSVAAGRKIAFVTQRGEQIVATAMINNYLKIPVSQYIKLEPLSDTNNNEIDDAVIFVHGQREEVYTLLVKMALGDDNYLHISNSDSVIIMCPPISGTEKIVNKALNTLYRYDLNLTFYDRDILRSSHASGDDLKLIYNLVKPKYIIPIKGEYRHMYEQMKIATSAGYKRDNIILLDNGEVANFVGGVLDERTQVHVGDIFVDGSLIGDVNEEVIKDRESLSNDGVIIISIYYDVRKRKVVREPMLTTRGLAIDLESTALASKIIPLSKSIFENSLWKKDYSLNQTEQTINEEIAKQIYRVTKHRPLIMVVAIDVSKTIDKLETKTKKDTSKILKKNSIVSEKKSTTSKVVKHQKPNYNNKKQLKKND